MIPDRIQHVRPAQYYLSTRSTELAVGWLPIVGAQHEAEANWPLFRVGVKVVRRYRRYGRLAWLAGWILSLGACMTSPWRSTDRERSKTSNDANAKAPPASANSGGISSTRATESAVRTVACSRRSTLPPWPDSVHASNRARLQSRGRTHGQLPIARRGRLGGSTEAGVRYLLISERSRIALKTIGLQCPIEPARSVRYPWPVAPSHVPCWR